MFVQNILVELNVGWLSVQHLGVQITLKSTGRACLKSEPLASFPQEQEFGAKFGVARARALAAILAFSVLLLVLKTPNTVGKAGGSLPDNPVKLKSSQMTVM